MTTDMVEGFSSKKTEEPNTEGDLCRLFAEL